jgi:hypothetical protein
MKVKVLNSLHQAYGHRFKVEFQQLLEQQTFAEVIFRNSNLLFNDENAPFYHTLVHCFSCSFDGMAIGLSRIWDEKGSDDCLISIPNLVTIFQKHNFLGCQSLAPGCQDRAMFDSLYADPIRSRLRVVRTEALAHSVVFGKSNDRKKSDINGRQEFDVMNGDVLAFCQKTLDLLFLLNDQLTISLWRSRRSMDEMKNEWYNRHVAFLRHFVPQVQ